MDSAGRRRLRPRRAIEQRIDRVTEPKRSSRQRKAWAIGLADMVEMSLHEVVWRCQQDLNILDEQELEWRGYEDIPVDQPDLSEDNDSYDFSEYDEDNPLADEDWPNHLDEQWEMNPFDSTEHIERGEPEPDIIIDEFGNVEIPREQIFLEYYGNLVQKGVALTQTAQLLCTNAQLLRSVAERLLKLEGHIILSGERDLSKVNFVPLTQKELLEPIGIREKSMRTRISNCYIQTPYWGIMHLSAFLQGSRIGWERVIDTVEEILASENPADPYTNQALWTRVKSAYPAQLKDNRQFRNAMRKAGIPLKKGRKEIFDATKRWQEDTNRKKVQLSEIPRIRRVLVDKYGMFTSKQTIQCRESQFVPFVEKRIADILRLLGLEVSHG